MTLKECLERIDEIKKAWPGGYNFENKSKMRGFSLGDKLITIEDAESRDWGIEFESLDKEFNQALNGFLNKQT